MPAKPKSSTESMVKRIITVAEILAKAESTQPKDTQD